MRNRNLIRIKNLCSGGLLNSNFSHDERQTLKQFRDHHHNARAFIIGTGPSLSVDDLNKLKNEITFACNKIYLSFNDTDWRPTYYSVIDRLVAENNHEAIAQLPFFKIFSSVVKPYFENASDIIWLNDLRSPTINGARQFVFSKNAHKGTYGGFTVIYTQLQLAYYMGIREVYLLGIDFDFKESSATGAKTSAGESILKNNGEPNHFHSKYRAQGELWTKPRLDYHYQAFSAAKNAFEAANKRIYNASRKTKLDLFQRVDLDTIL
ncbi:DUF115 domain-containing protein [Gammaproteobacteria bacterium]|nr:DUF115 domain-containing protein [Gammaproteobacteria bacterium]